MGFHLWIDEDAWYSPEKEADRLVHENSKAFRKFSRRIDRGLRRLEERFRDYQRLTPSEYREARLDRD